MEPPNATRGPIRIDEVYDALIYDPSKSTNQRRLEVIALADRFESLGYKLINDRYGNERPFKNIAKDIYHLAVDIDPMKYVMYSDKTPKEQMDAVLQIAELFNTQYGANIITRLNPTDITDKRLRSLSDIADDLYLAADKIYKNLRKSSRQMSTELHRAVDALVRSREFLLDEHRSKQNVLLNSLGKLVPKSEADRDKSGGKPDDGNYKTPLQLTDTLKLLNICNTALIKLNEAVSDNVVSISTDKLSTSEDIAAISRIISEGETSSTFAASGFGNKLVNYSDERIDTYAKRLLDRLDSQINKKIEYIQTLGQKFQTTGNRLADLERITQQLSRRSSDPERVKRLAYVMSNIEMQNIKNKRGVEQLLEIIRADDLDGSPAETVETVLRIIELNSTKLFKTREEFREIYEYFSNLLRRLRKTEISLNGLLSPDKSTQFVNDLYKSADMPAQTDDAPGRTIVFDQKKIDSLNKTISEWMNKP